MPFLVILYNKLGRKTCYLLFTLPIILGTWINYKSSYAHDLTAGIFSLENYYMFSDYINKPWYKLGVYFLGIISAMFWIDIRDYKASKRLNTEDWKQFKLVDFLHRSDSKSRGTCCKAWMPVVLCVLAVVGWIVTAFIAFPTMVSPYIWSDNANSWFYALTRVVFAASTLTVFFLVVLDHSPILRHMWANKNINIVGCLVYPCYILAPIVYMNMYCTCSSAIYMTMVNNIYLGMGAMWCTVIVSMFFVFFFSNPIEKLMNNTVRRLHKISPKT